MGILANFGKILADPTFSDFTFDVKGKKLKVHRNILAASSPVMHKLFTANFNESEKQCCFLNEIEPEIFEYLLQFIYTGELPINLNYVSKSLYDAANYYEIEELKEICKQKIHETLSLENALEIYEWSKPYDMTDLKTESWEIVKRDILKIYFPLAREPLTPDEISSSIEQKEKEEKFWEKFKKLEV